VGVANVKVGVENFYSLEWELQHFFVSIDKYWQD